MTYKKVKDTVTGTEIKNIIFRKADNGYIPFDPANTDYALYLEWVAAGNTAEEAD